MKTAEGRVVLTVAVVAFVVVSGAMIVDAMRRQTGFNDPNVVTLGIVMVAAAIGMLVYVVRVAMGLDRFIDREARWPSNGQELAKLVFLEY